MVINPFQFAACSELSAAYQIFHTAFILKWQLTSVHQEKGDHTVIMVLSPFYSFISSHDNDKW